MKSRIITGLVGSVLALVVLLCPYPFLLNVAMAVICALVMYEILIVTRFVNHRGLMAGAVAFAMTTPFFFFGESRTPALMILLAYVLFLAVMQIAYHETLAVERTGFVFFVSIIVPIALSCMAYLRPYKHGLFYVFLVIIMPWLCDIGAYFIGTFLGKHKLCPSISPKKTVEGLVGGFLISIASSVLAAWLYQILALDGTGEAVSLWQVALLALACAPLSVMGDLFASIIKRQCRVKDFGHIIPGHGGIMDRFDSIIFVAPVMFILVQYLPLVYPV